MTAHSVPCRACDGLGVVRVIAFDYIDGPNVTKTEGCAACAERRANAARAEVESLHADLAALRAALHEACDMLDDVRWVNDAEERQATKVRLRALAGPRLDAGKEPGR